MLSRINTCNKVSASVSVFGTKDLVIFILSFLLYPIHSRGFSFRTMSVMPFILTFQSLYTAYMEWKPKQHFCLVAPKPLVSSILFFCENNRMLLWARNNTLSFFNKFQVNIIDVVLTRDDAMMYRLIRRHDNIWIRLDNAIAKGSINVMKEIRATIHERKWSDYKIINYMRSIQKMGLLIEPDYPDTADYNHVCSTLFTEAALLALGDDFKVTDYEKKSLEKYLCKHYLYSFKSKRSENVLCYKAVAL